MDCEKCTILEGAISALDGVLARTQEALEESRAECEMLRDYRSRAQRLQSLINEATLTRGDLVRRLGDLERVLHKIVEEARSKDENNMSIAHWEAFELLGLNNNNEEE